MTDGRIIEYVRNRRELDLPAPFRSNRIYNYSLGGESMDYAVGIFAYENNFDRCRVYGLGLNVGNAASSRIIT